MSAYILLNVESRALHDVVFVVQDNADAKAAEFGSGWVVIPRELEEVAPATPEVTPATDTPAAPTA